MMVGFLKDDSSFHNEDLTQIVVWTMLMQPWLYFIWLLRQVWKPESCLSIQIERTLREVAAKRYAVMRLAQLQHGFIHEESITGKGGKGWTLLRQHMKRRKLEYRISDRINLKSIAHVAGLILSPNKPGTAQVQTDTAQHTVASSGPRK